jgi:hypothetical protein
MNTLIALIMCLVVLSPMLLAFLLDDTHGKLASLAYFILIAVVMTVIILIITYPIYLITMQF